MTQEIANLTDTFEFLPKHLELIQDPAPQGLAVGGIRSGKTLNLLMAGVLFYCLAYERCDMLVLRKTLKELEAGAIQDFKTFVPQEIYDWNENKKTATFINGSRIVFGHIDNTESDILTYLGQAYPIILVDECAQISNDAWDLLCSRNTINPGCRPNAQGKLPIPRIFGATNPFGPYWNFYYTVFVQKQPWDKPEGCRMDKTGAHWVDDGTGNWRCIFNPVDYAYTHSTVLDNPFLLARDPGLIARLNRLPEAQRQRMLYGNMGIQDGQFYDNFSVDVHAINLRKDPDRIIWQEHQPRWIGWDWGTSHYFSVYWFTLALVRNPVTKAYSEKAVCYREYVDRGKANDFVVGEIARRSKGEKISHIYFSHEQFQKRAGDHSPASDVSIRLREVGLPMVSPPNNDRLSGASFIYQLFDRQDIVILDTCYELIQAIPQLMRNPERPEDVLKLPTKADDIYDGFRYGCVSMLKPKKTPDIVRIREQAKTIQDPLVRHFFVAKRQAELAHRSDVIKPNNIPAWRARFQGK